MKHIEWSAPQILEECQRLRPWIRFTIGTRWDTKHLVSVQGLDYPSVCYNQTSSEPMVITYPKVAPFATIQAAIDTFISEVDKVVNNILLDRPPTMAKLVGDPIEIICMRLTVLEEKMTSIERTKAE